MSNKFQETIAKSVRHRASYKRPGVLLFDCKNPVCTAKTQRGFWCRDCENEIVKQLIEKRRASHGG